MFNEENYDEINRILREIHREQDLNSDENCRIVIASGEDASFCHCKMENL